MTDQDKILLQAFDEGNIASGDLLQQLSIDIKNNPDFIRNEVSAAIISADPDNLQLTIALIWLSGIDLMKEYSHSTNDGIRKEMQYRLAKQKS